MLFKADAISRAEYEAALADKKISSARLDRLDAQIARQNSTPQADLATLDFTKICAPAAETARLRRRRFKVAIFQNMFDARPPTRPAGWNKAHEEAARSEEIL